MTSPRLGLLGGECTGKSTIAESLQARIGAVVAGEVLREFVDVNGRVPHPGEQRGIMQEQRERELTLAAGPGVRLLIGDPATAMTAIYSDVYFGDTSLFPEATAQALEYGAILWCRPDIPWVAEPGQHDGPEYRDRVDHRIAQYVHDELLPHGVAVHELTGTHLERLQVALLVSETLLSAPV
jgi:nicotinamide riboside kinase